MTTDPTASREPRVLLVDDDRELCQMLSEYLDAEHFDVKSVHDGGEALAELQAGEFEIVILDVMLPSVGGLDVMRKLGASYSTPILMLTARGEEEDRILGLDLGADDYVTKPFSVRELLARARALLRRSIAAQPLPDELRIGDIVVDFRSYEAHRNGRPIDLTRKEFGVLRLLAACEGRVVTRDELLETVWGLNAGQSTRTIDNHVATLRAKLEDDPSHPRTLHTVHGVGYKLVRER
jgi:two-component system response regulator RegX3